jgi:NhaP-type Na+/H+ or K+/H+ antiporter
MRDSTFDVNGLFVQLLQYLVVLHLGVHLNFERVDLQKLSALLLILFALVILTFVNYWSKYANSLPCTTTSAV